MQQQLGQTQVMLKMNDVPLSSVGELCIGKQHWAPFFYSLTYNWSFFYNIKQKISPEINIANRKCDKYKTFDIDRREKIPHDFQYGFLSVFALIDFF